MDELARVLEGACLHVESVRRLPVPPTVDGIAVVEVPSRREHRRGDGRGREVDEGITGSLDALEWFEADVVVCPLVDDPNLPSRRAPGARAWNPSGLAVSPHGMGPRHATAVVGAWLRDGDRLRPCDEETECVGDAPLRLLFGIEPGTDSVDVWYELAVSVGTVDLGTG